ncbi:MAG TPA: rRNA pseudouridine synthase [Clostridiaceae bacterium]|jgi:16S rRNA pseudouridine516 synthase|nr:rRNA pseudouridine synthase [Clostridiaceae bacterium]
MPKLRLDKFLKDQGIASRSEARELIRKGSVSVNDVIVKNPGTHVNTDEDIINVKGEQVEYRQFVYYMLNKPKGVITATEDKTLKTVLDLFPDEIRRRGVFPVGRLDKDTEGLLLITNDGIFAHNLLSPKKGVKKLYEALLDSFPGEDAIKKFEEGVYIGDNYTALPAKLQYISKDPVRALVEICEGKFHQVKRMFKAVGASVIELKRLRMGNIRLDETLKPGQFRELTPEELCQGDGSSDTLFPKNRKNSTADTPDV